VPDNCISGGKVLKRGTTSSYQPSGHHTPHGRLEFITEPKCIGRQFPKIAPKTGAPKAITAMAHKLARLVHHMLKFGNEYTDKGAEHYETKSVSNR